MISSAEAMPANHGGRLQQTSQTWLATLARPGRYSPYHARDRLLQLVD
jgi:hypothetical protein